MKKKVLLIAPMSSVHERFNIANISALEELDCEIHLAANFSVDEHSGEYGKDCEKNGYTIHNIPFERASILKNLKCIPTTYKLLKDGKFDLVHCHTETGGIVTRFSAFLLRHTDVLYTPHGMSFYKGSSLKSQLIYRPIERFICGGMKMNFAMNSEEYEMLKKWNKKSAAFVHGAGVNLESVTDVKTVGEEKYTELGLNPNRKILLSIGELNDNKNHKVIIEALANLPAEERPQYIVCGVGDKKDELVSLAEKLGMGKDVFFPGYRYDIPEILHMADIFAFPSFHEGLSVALMQAMAAGLPVVCSKIRGNVDLIDNNGGYLYSPDDVCGFEQGIKELLSDEEKCIRFGRYNSEKVRLCSLENVKKELLDKYRLLLR